MSIIHQASTVIAQPVGVSSAVSVQLPIISLSAVLSSGPVFSGIKIDSNGTIYKRDGTTTWVTTGNDWLLSGLNENVWVECTLDSGSLFASSSTGVRLQCTTDYFWQVRDNIQGDAGVTANITIKLWDAATGGNELASRAYNPDAEWTV